MRPCVDVRIRLMSGCFFGRPASVFDLPDGPGVVPVRVIVGIVVGDWLLVVVHRLLGGNEFLARNDPIVAIAELAGALGMAAYGAERLTFGAFDLGGIGAPAALELEMVANCVVE
jgi:xanthosine utilization system XapX-like protein